MGYARMCPYCGAHLDPGEHCDCRETDIMDINTIVDGHNSSIHYCKIVNKFHNKIAP